MGSKRRARRRGKAGKRNGYARSNKRVKRYLQSRAATQDTHGTGIARLWQDATAAAIMSTWRVKSRDGRLAPALMDLRLGSRIESLVWRRCASLANSRALLAKTVARRACPRAWRQHLEYVEVGGAAELRNRDQTVRLWLRTPLDATPLAIEARRPWRPPVRENVSILAPHHIRRGASQSRAY